MPPGSTICLHMTAARAENQCLKQLELSSQTLSTQLYNATYISSTCSVLHELIVKERKCARLALGRAACLNGLSHKRHLLAQDQRLFASRRHKPNKPHVGMRVKHQPLGPLALFQGPEQNAQPLWWSKEEASLPKGLQEVPRQRPAVELQCQPAEEVR